MTQTVRAILVGCGGISGAWLDACAKMNDVQIIGLVDINETAAREKAEKYGLNDAVVGTNLKSILKQVKTDVVFDCTIPEAHAEVTIAALKQGCHVLGEKPLADSMSNARKMVETAEKSGRTYAVMQNRRYDANIRRIKAFLDSNKLGNMTTVSSDFYIGAHFGGFRAEMQHVLLLDMAIHTFDAARLISGANPVSVIARDWNPKNSWFKHGASACRSFRDDQTALFTHTAAVGRPRGIAQHGKQTGISSARRGASSGTARKNSKRLRQLKATNSSAMSSRICPEIPSPKTGWHYGCIRDFIDCIKDRRNSRNRLHRQH